MQISHRRVIQVKGTKIRKVLRWEKSPVSIKDSKYRQSDWNATSAGNKGPDNDKKDGRDQIQNIFTYEIESCMKC